MNFHDFPMKILAHARRRCFRSIRRIETVEGDLKSATAQQRVVFHINR